MKQKSPVKPIAKQCPPNSCQMCVVVLTLVYYSTCLDTLNRTVTLSRYMLKWIRGELEHSSTMNIIGIIIEADMWIRLT